MNDNMTIAFEDIYHNMSLSTKIIYESIFLLSKYDR